MWWSHAICECWQWEWMPQRASDAQAGIQNAGITALHRKLSDSEPEPWTLHLKLPNLGRWQMAICFSQAAQVGQVSQHRSQYNYSWNVARTQCSVSCFPIFKGEHLSVFLRRGTCPSPIWGRLDWRKQQEIWDLAFPSRYLQVGCQFLLVCLLSLFCFPK